MQAGASRPLAHTHPSPIVGVECEGPGADAVLAQLHLCRRAVASAEGWDARQDDVEDDAEGPDVTGGRVRAARQHLWRLVLERPDGARPRLRLGLADDKGEAEVGDDGLRGLLGGRVEDVFGPVRWSR